MERSLIEEITANNFIIILVLAFICLLDNIIIEEELGMDKDRPDSMECLDYFKEQ